MGQRHILHCDCNCFYASVEMQEHPELRGKSIAVCGDPEARHGIVLTASYPAKRMGVKTGMPIWEAKQHCRDLIIVPASYGKYQKYSGYVREVFNDYTEHLHHLPARAGFANLLLRIENAQHLPKLFAFGAILDVFV